MLAILLERAVRRFLLCLVSLVCCGSIASADRPIFLVTPAGVYQSIVSDAGIPGAWEKISADVIVTGFGGNVPDTPKPTPDAPKPEPDATDPIVKDIERISWDTLANNSQATAVAAVVDSIGKLGLTKKEFKEAMDMSIPIVDKSLNAGGALETWWIAVSKVTTDWQKIKAGVSATWDVDKESLSAIAAAAEGSGVVTGEAVNWSQIIAIIQMILTLLKNLGIGGGR